MRNFLLSVALVVGLILPIGAAHAQSTSTVTATCKDGTAFTGTKPSGACRDHGGVQSWGEATSPALHLLRLRPRPASAPLQAPVAAPVKSGSIPPVKSTTAPVIAGTARPSTAVACRRRKRRRRAVGQTTVRLAPRKLIEAAVCPSRA
jgi:hypothetical protein